MAANLKGVSGANLTAVHPEIDLYIKGETTYQDMSPEAQKAFMQHQRYIETLRILEKSHKINGDQMMEYLRLTSVGDIKTTLQQDSRIPQDEKPILLQQVDTVASKYPESPTGPGYCSVSRDDVRVTGSKIMIRDGYVAPYLSTKKGLLVRGSWNGWARDEKGRNVDQQMVLQGGWWVWDRGYPFVTSTVELCFHKPGADLYFPHEMWARKKFDPAPRDWVGYVIDNGQTSVNLLLPVEQ